MRGHVQGPECSRYFKYKCMMDAELVPDRCPSRYRRGPPQDVAGFEVVDEQDAQRSGKRIEAELGCDRFETFGQEMIGHVGTARIPHGIAVDKKGCFSEEDLW